MESAVAEIVALDQAHGDQLEALSVLLLRTESVASSKIESVEASLDDFAPGPSRQQGKRLSLVDGGRRRGLRAADQHD
jgi:hypothetical protein